MQLKLRYAFSKMDKPLSISEAVGSSIIGFQMDNGQVERAMSVADSAANHLGQLVEMLHTRKVLTDQDVLAITGGCYDIVPDEDKVKA